jgi:hypothetical protein
MKKLLVTFFAVLMVFAVQAQETKTLIGDGVSVTSGFGGFMLQFAPAGGSIRSFSGGGGAALLSNGLYFGGYGMGLTENLRTFQNNVEYDVDFGHGGFLLGYTIKPGNMVHAGLSSRLGWGEIDFDPIDPTAGRLTEDHVFVLNPQVELEINMTSWFKINAGAGYQFVTGVENVFYQPEDFNGPAFGLSFLFGWFD